MNKIPIDLIELLSDGLFHSGEEIGLTIGMTRAGVWKQLQKLEELGLGYESVKGKGYRLIERLVFVSADQIRKRLEANVYVDAVAHIEVHKSLSSTNTLAQSLLQKQPPPFLIIAEHQSDGKGRRGKRWVSPFGQNIYLSLSWRFNEGMAKLDGLSLVVGLAVVDTLDFLGIEGAMLKWPNDVYLNNKKIGGILLEVSGDPIAECDVIIGVGLNVNSRNKNIQVDQPWSSLLIEQNQSFDRNDLVVHFVNRLTKLIPLFIDNGFDHFYSRWNQVDWLLNKKICIYQGDNVEMGTACGVTEEGALLLDCGRSFKSGEVSVRKDYG